MRGLCLSKILGGHVLSFPAAVKETMEDVERRILRLGRNALIAALGILIALWLLGAFGR
jgi:hypothetical protein